jgi:hypothetical protein
LEKAKQDKEAQGEFESVPACTKWARSAICPGYCGAQDTFYVGTFKDVGCIYQQTFIDTYAKVGFACPLGNAQRQDYSERILPGRLPQENLRELGGPAGRSRCLDAGL